MQNSVFRNLCRLTHFSHSSLYLCENKKTLPFAPQTQLHTNNLMKPRLWTFPFHSMFLVRRWVVVHLNAQQFVNEPTHMAIWGPTSLKRTRQDFFWAMIQEHEMIEYFGQVPANSTRLEIWTPTHILLHCNRFKKYFFITFFPLCGTCLCHLFLKMHDADLIVHGPVTTDCFV